MFKAARIPFLFLFLLIAVFATAQKARFEFYTKANGLVGNQIGDIAQDDQGFIWFLNGTRLLRFDGRKFLPFPLPVELTTGTTRFETLAIFQDSLLLLALPNSVILLNPKNGTWETIPLPKLNGQASVMNSLIPLGPDDILLQGFNQNNIEEMAVWRFREQHFDPLELHAENTTIKTGTWPTIDALGNWYLFKPGLLQVFDRSGNKKREVVVPRANGNIGGTTWATFGSNNTLVCLSDNIFFKLDKTGDKFLPHPASRFLTNNRSLRRFILQENGSIWACGDANNLIYYDAVQDTLFDFREAMETLIPHGCNFYQMVQGKTGAIWVATQLGLLKIVPQGQSFDTYFSGLSKDKTYYSFRGLAEDNKGMVFGSYYRSGAKIDPVNKREYPEAFPVEWPFGLYAEGDALWLNSGKLWNCSTNTFAEVSGSLANTLDWGVFTKDKTGRLWLACLLDLYYLNEQAGSLKWEKALQLPIDIFNSPDVIHAGQYSGLIWIGFQESLFSYSPETKKLRQFGPKELGLPVSRIMAIEENREGNLWLGTDIGLVYFKPATGRTRQFSVKDGLPDDYVCGMLPEGDSCLWLSTSHGLSRFHIAEGAFVNFFKEDGLTDDEFNRTSYLKAHDGRMFFGGMRGVNAFFPQELMRTYRRKNGEARMVLSAFERTDERRDTLIREYKFGRQPEIHLYHWDRSFTFEYALTDFSNPNEVKYSYRMEGYEDTWSEPSTFNFTRFSSLPSGDYVFRVKARDSHGLWHPNELAVKVVVHPPWWATWWAYLAYALLFAGLAYAIFSFLKKRLLLQNQLKLEHEESVRLKELDHFKSRLYTNLTHEFRTPLTVILGMTGQIRNEPKKYLEEGTRLIETNGKNLLQLINQLLDLSKLENKSFQLQLQQADIVPYIRYVTESFQTYANSRNLSLRFFSTLESLVLDYDPDQLKQVLTNLISNAVKFTPSGGEVAVRLSKAEGVLILEVRDSGIGIAETDLPHVFDRFYQVDGSHTRAGEGTGIGLAHTLELVKVMGGKISVESKPGMGSTFLVRLPITNKAIINTGVPLSNDAEIAPNQLTPTPELPTPLQTSNSELQTILIIEDNPDVVVYLKSCLNGLYQVDVAYNGKIGIEKALENIPDIIISDVMMPEKDGYQVCDTLKNDERTSHIPVILLTAKADSASRITGLKRGADAYLTKPFDKEELLVRLEMLVERQQRMAAYFSKNLLAGTTATPGEPEIAEAIEVENAFMQKVWEIVDENYSKEDFGLLQLCQKIGMSRSQLFRKMQALSGTSPSDFIRSYRLSKAKTLLETTDMNVSETAWAVGFKDPGHFSKWFHEEFGFPPSATSK